MAKMYSNALEENIKFQFADYINSVHEKLIVEKYISVMTNTQTALVKMKNGIGFSSGIFWCC